MGKVDPYLHAVLVLHGLGKEVTKDAIVAIIKAAGGEADEAKASVVAEAVKDVNIDEAIEKAAVAVAAAPAAAPAAAGGEEKKEEKKEEESEEKKEEEAAAGLASLFG